jgi:copper chaperone
METIVLNIKGMTCMGCVKSVKTVLEPIAGVSGVDVSLEKNQATISFDPAKASATQFKNAIHEAGFEVVG